MSLGDKPQEPHTRRREALCQFVKYFSRSVWSRRLLGRCLANYSVDRDMNKRLASYALFASKGHVVRDVELVKN